MEQHTAVTTLAMNLMADVASGMGGNRQRYVPENKKTKSDLRVCYELEVERWLSYGIQDCDRLIEKLVKVAPASRQARVECLLLKTKRVDAEEFPQDNLVDALMLLEE